jgi:hypothetical protein
MTKSKLAVQQDGSQMVSAATLAREWDTSPNSVRRLLAEAGITPCYLSGKRRGTVRYVRDEIQEFLRKSRNTAATTGN